MSGFFGRLALIAIIPIGAVTLASPVKAIGLALIVIGLSVLSRAFSRLEP